MFFQADYRIFAATLQDPQHNAYANDSLQRTSIRNVVIRTIVLLSICWWSGSEVPEADALLKNVFSPSAASTHCPKAICVSGSSEWQRTASHGGPQPTHRQQGDPFSPSLQLRVRMSAAPTVSFFGHTQRDVHECFLVALAALYSYLRYRHSQRV